MPKRARKRNRRGASNKKGRKSQATSMQPDLEELPADFMQATNAERVYQEENNNHCDANREESEDSSGCEATEGAQEWKEWYKQQQKLQKMNECSENLSDWCCKSKENEDLSIDCQFKTESIEHASSGSSQCSMTDISIYDSTDEEPKIPISTLTEDEDAVSDAEIIRRNNYASNSCRHEIGEFCECSKSKDFRNLDGEQAAHGRTYHGMIIFIEILAF